MFNFHECGELHPKLSKSVHIKYHHPPFPLPHLAPPPPPKKKKKIEKTPTIKI